MLEDKNVLFVYTDGGSRGNPGESAIGIVGILNKQEVFAQARKIGHATNNIAEHYAFLKSVDCVADFIKTTKVVAVVWKLDSKLVVEQLNKRWKIKNNELKLIAEKSWESLKQITISIKIAHVDREQNQRADELVNEALDRT